LNAFRAGTWRTGPFPAASNHPQALHAQRLNRPIFPEKSRFLPPLDPLVACVSPGGSAKKRDCRGAKMPMK